MIVTLRSSKTQRPTKVLLMVLGLLVWGCRSERQQQQEEEEQQDPNNDLLDCREATEELWVQYSQALEQGSVEFVASEKYMFQQDDTRKEVVYHSPESAQKLANVCRDVGGQSIVIQDGRYKCTNNDDHSEIELEMVYMAYCVAAIPSCNKALDDPFLMVQADVPRFNLQCDEDISDTATEPPMMPPTGTDNFESSETVPEATAANNYNDNDNNQMPPSEKATSESELENENSQTRVESTLETEQPSSNSSSLEGENEEGESSGNASNVDSSNDSTDTSQAVIAVAFGGLLVIGMAAFALSVMNFGEERSVQQGYEMTNLHLEDTEPDIDPVIPRSKRGGYQQVSTGSGKKLSSFL